MTQYTLPGIKKASYDTHMLRFISAIIGMTTTLFSTCAAQHIVLTKEQQSATSTLSAWLSIPDRMDIHVFSSAEYELQVIDNGDEGSKHPNLESAMTRHACTAGINGGFFKDDRYSTPIGLLIENSAIISHLIRSGFIAAGVVYDTGADIRIERWQKLSTNTATMKHAIQSGPFLIENGKIVNGLNNKKKARRTFIATDSRGTWCIGCTSSLTLRELGEWLEQVTLPGGNRIQHALNMDGGSSSAYWDSTDSTYSPSFKRVRNYIGIRPRKR